MSFLLFCSFLYHTIDRFGRAVEWWCVQCCREPCVGEHLSRAPNELTIIHISAKPRTFALRTTSALRPSDSGLPTRALDARLTNTPSLRDKSDPSPFVLRTPVSRIGSWTLGKPAIPRRSATKVILRPPSFGLRSPDSGFGC